MRSMLKSRNAVLHLMLLPGVLLVFIYSYIPMAGLYIAFQRFIPAKGLFGDQKWIGFDNFRYVFYLPEFNQILWNTFFIAFMKIVLGLIVPVIVALLLNELRISWIKRSIQTMIYFPYFLSWVILGEVIIDLLSPGYGIVNQVIRLFGGEPIYFLASKEMFPWIMILSDVWKSYGFGTIIFLAALTTINPEYYESATVDGASRWRQTLNITIPGIMPIVILVGVLSIGQILNAGFEQILTLLNPVVQETGDIIDTFVYRIGLIEAQFGVATAIGLFKSVISLIFISLSYYMAYKLADYRVF